MSRTFVTDLKYFIDEQGVIPEALARRTRHFIENLGAIIALVTEKPGASPRRIVCCWNKIKSKPCCGKIDAGIDIGSLKIFWHCLKCGDNGSISSWRNTLWDNSYLKK